MNTDISFPVTVKIALANTFVLISICDHRPDSIFCCAALAARDNCLLNTYKELDMIIDTVQSIIMHLKSIKKIFT